jgi:hypothetical protein
VYANSELNEKILKLSETLQPHCYGNVANLLGGNKLTFPEGYGRWAVLVASKEVSSVANGDVKVGRVLIPKEEKRIFWYFK